MSTAVTDIQRDTNINSIDGTDPPIATIVGGDGTTDSIELAGFSGGSFKTPSALTNTTLTLEVSMDESTWFTIRDPIDRSVLANWAGDGPALAVNTIYALPPEVFYYRYIRLNVGGVEAAGREFEIFLRS